MLSLSSISWVPICLFTQDLCSFRIGSALLSSVFRGLLYAFQQHVFYQHFLQHLLHITTAAIWFHLEEYHIMYGKAVIAYLFVKYILLWKMSSMALYSMRWCYFLFIFSTVNSLKKETMEIVYCPFHTYVSICRDLEACSWVNAESTQRLKFQT